MDNTNPIVKTVIYKGRNYIPIAKGSKVHFHFQTWKLGKQRVLIDDSKKIGKKEPMVLIIGHKFKLEVWETIVTMMAVNEVSSFRVKKELLFNYPFVSKTLREAGQEPKCKHNCTMTLHTEGLGFADLDDLMNKPTDLEFIIEILKVERPDEYEKEIWLLNAEERLELIPTLKEKGNVFYSKKLYDEAEDAYTKAIGICEQLMIKERKSDPEWVVLNNTKLPILLNYVQCKLLKGEYYEVIKHCDTVLEYDKDNEKALYRRGKAHVGAWNPDLAESDFKRLKDINPNMAATVDKELDNIKKMRKLKEEEDKNSFKNLFAVKVDT